MTVEDIINANERAARFMFDGELEKARKAAEDVSRIMPSIVEHLGDPATPVSPLEMRVHDWFVFKLESERLVESCRRLDEAKRVMMVMKALREALGLEKPKGGL